MGRSPSAGSLQQRHHRLPAGKRASPKLAILGAVRPFISAVFSLVIFALDRAGLLPLKPPQDVDDLYFYAAIAFFAGFSERWARAPSRTRSRCQEQTRPGVDPQLPAAHSRPA